MQTAVAIFFILHGLVHAILAMSPSPGASEPVFATFFSSSWLLSRLGVSKRSSSVLAIILAALAAIGFVAAGLALLEILVPFDWWPILTLVSAVISLLLLVIYWSRYMIVGIVIDLAVLAALVLFSWSPE